MEQGIPKPARWTGRWPVAVALAAVVSLAATPTPPLAAISGPADISGEQINCGLTRLVCQVATGEDGTCPGPEQSCSIDLTLYHIYMARLGKGVKLRSLHPRHVELLAPHYPKLDLSLVRLGHSSLQPLRNATTDCLNIYFNDALAVDRFVTGKAKVHFRGGKPDPDSTHLDWLLHELRHAEQCMELGGRDAYARRWFSELTRSGLLLLKGSSQLLHDAMIMEEDADAVAIEVLRALGGNLDARGELVEELALLPLVRAGLLRVGAPLPVILTANARGGAAPLKFTWSMKRPGRGDFYRVPEAEGRIWHNQLVWTPGLAGTYQIKVEVRHPGGRLAPVSRVYTLQVEPRQLQICSRFLTM